MPISGPPRGDGPLRVLTRAPRAVWALLVLNGLLVVCWSILTPIYHSPDEPTHADAVMRLVQGLGWERIGHAVLTPQGDFATDASPYGIPANPRTLSHVPIKQADAIPRYARPNWADLNEPNRPINGTIQQMTQHPPGYYWAEALVVKLFGGAHQRWDRAVGLMRLTSALMIMPLPLLAWGIVFRLFGDNRAGVAAAAVTLAVPELSSIGGAVNNDNALTLTAGLLLVGLACVLRGDRSLRTAVFVGVSLGLALFSKSLALVLIPLVPACYLTAWAYQRRRVPGAMVALQPAAADEEAGTGKARGVPVWDTLLRPSLLALVVAFAFGGWWYLANILRYGAIQPSVPGFPPGQFLGDDWQQFTSLATNSMLQRYWGSIGWFEVQMPFRYVYVAGGVAFVLVVLAVLGTRRPRGGRLAVLLMLWPTLASYGLVVEQALRYYERTHYYTGLSGRYVFVGFVGAAAAVGIGATRVPGLRRWAPLLLLAGAAVLQAKEVRLSVLVWWQPPGGTLGQAWDAMLSWSPWSPLIVKTVVVLTGLALAIVVVELLLTALRRERTDPEIPEPASVGDGSPATADLSGASTGVMSPAARPSESAS